MPVVDNNGTDIHYEVVGTGPPLVLQHGRLGSGRFWHDFGYVSALCTERTLILIDARGHGRSDKPHNADSYLPRDMASDVIGVVDAVGFERTDFFGYSMGGRIGFATVAHFPDRINLLIAGGAGPYGPAVSRQAELDLARTLAGGMEAYLSGMERMLNRTIPEADRLALAANDAEALAALATATADWPDMASRVAEAAPPIQLFGGTADPIWELIERAHLQLPTSVLHRFEGLGHGDDLRLPELVLPVLERTLERSGLRP